MTIQDRDEVAVRRKTFLKPLLRPRSGRRLPRELYPEAVFARTASWPQGVRDPRFAQLIQAIDQSPYHLDTRLQIYFEGRQAFEDMLMAIRSARREVLVESYIIKDDDTGMDFLEALRAAAARGVDVRILADSFGSSATHRDFWNLLRRSGTRLRLFGRPHYAPRSLLPILDHRKLLIVDRQIAFTGGMNIANEYRGHRPGREAWRDTHVRLCGGIAWELAVLFGEGWVAAGGESPHYDPLATDSDGGVAALVLDSRPGRGIDEVYAAFAAVAGAVRRRLWVTNAYFAPSRRMRNLLYGAAARGVDVRLLLPAKSDIPVIRLAGRGHYRELLAAGIRIFEFEPAVLHAKTLVADGHVAVIGSTNFDFRSFNFNAECNVLVLDDDIGAQMEARFLEDLAESTEITAAMWAGLPWWYKLLARMARLLAVFL